MPTNTKKKYQKKKPIEHCLLRPDMYVGSTRLRTFNEYVAWKQDGGDYKIVWRSIRSSPAILRIFIEALSNAIDNVERSRKTKTPCTKIKVTIDPETGETSIWNDGDVVPVEIHEEEGCYNHTMIFGQLLTGSSYNDEEERMIAGRNGIGIKTCLKKGTLIPKFNGEIVKIENLEVGDCVIGDDGLRRNITNKCEGNAKLFEVSQPRGNSYIVNENHILSLRMPDHKVIFWNTDKNGWSILWLDKENMKVCSKYISASPPKVVCTGCNQELCSNLGRHYKRMHKDKEVPKKTRRSPTVIPPEKPEVRQALQEMKEFAETIPDDNTIDIDIKDYMKLNKTTQGRLTGFVGECVEWEEKEVKLDPYVLGLWLGDGSKRGYVFAINSKDDPEILEYLEEWGKENDATFKNIPSNPVAYYISSTTKSGVAPLKKLLSEYNLVDNKHIPQEYLVNSREVRLAVLAGMIDSDGTVQSDGRRITIAQGMDHSKLAGDVIFLAKSLGLMCSSHIKKTQWKYKGELRRGNAININISGDIEDIPTLVARKKCYNPLSRNVTNTGKISIQEVESGDYVGIEVDGNKRFVLEDFTVTHNCNIFSSSFQVKGYDPSSNKLFTQTWTNNMLNPGKPKITKSRLVRGYTRVTWIPDFKRFGLKKYTKDIIQLYTRHVLDAAMLSKVNVYLNGDLVPIKSLSQYSGLYNSPTEEKLLIKNKDSTILVTPSTEPQVVSFVNGVYTRLGGQHVDAWSEAIFRPIVDKFNGKGKKSKSKSPKINITDVRQFFRLFIVASVVRPEFDGQEKNKLESPGITAEVKRSHITALCKWSVMDKIEDIIRAKEMVVLRKAERKKKNVKIDGLDPANNAGGRQSRHCSLFICEGLSAKTYVVAGIETGVYGKSGRDWFGVLPVTGKVLNVRNATPTSIAANKVIVSLIQTLGLSHGLDYRLEKNFKTLRYGRVIVVADADVDGIHIEGLIMNLIHTLFPTLLERDDPYIVSMKTPIARVFRGRAKDLLFYDERRFNKYLAKATKKVNAKYYKGLGTTREEDVPDTFGLKMVEFSNDEKASANMNKVFHKKYADARKQWLGEYAPDSYAFSLDDQGDTCTMSISNFLNGEMIKFSHADCARSIPSGIDGLKESQRKILYAVRKRKLNFGGKSLKVAQLSGYTAEHSNYHHGEQNLQDTIVGMASGFPGTNNIPLLYPDGGFGTRLEGGKDAASARYIFTKKEALTDYIFRSEDDPLLTPVNDDGDLVQPEHYMPIIPMILVNGCFAPETQIPLFSGEFKRADEITVGDVLIGDDGNPRIVQKLFNGQDTMYTIDQKIGDSYTVNSKHILTLKNTGNRSVFWHSAKKSWKIEWFDNETNKLRSKIFPAKKHKDEDIRLIAEEYASQLEGDGIVEITATDYLKLPKYVQKRLRGYKGVGVNWKYKDIKIDPYILGMWLGDGDSHGRGFSSADDQLAQVWEQFADVNNMEVSKDKCYCHSYHYYLRSKIKNGRVKGELYHPFRKLLDIYNLLENKHIPYDYIYNSKKVRLSLLAGLIDTDGHVYHNGEQITISQCPKRKHMLESAQLIARSLGFYANIRKTTQTKKYPSYSLSISGNGLEDIPTILKRKICSARRKSQRDCSTSPIEVTEKGIGLYYGWSVDCNQRFVLNDFTVTHNCTAGIGTGWSCTIPCFNPLDIIASIRVWLDNDGEVILEEPETGEICCLLPELVPWYRAFKGEIAASGDNRFKTEGILTRGSKRNTAEITELPIGMWTNKFKESCEDLVMNKKLKAIKNYSSTQDVHFILTESSDGIKCNKSNMKLHTYLYTSNMVLFNEKDQLKKFETPQQIIDKFCVVRLEYYVKRKKHQIKALEQRLQVLGNKERFITEVIEKTVPVMEQDEDATIEQLEEREYDKDPQDQTYNYLLRLPIRTFTTDKVEELKSDITGIEKDLSTLQKTKVEKIWLRELKEFEKEYGKWLKVMKKRVPKKTKKRRKK